MKRLALFTLLLFPALGLAQAPTDYDADGISDVGFVNISKTGLLSWGHRGSATKKAQTLPALGVNGNHLAVGRWKAGSTAQSGIVALQGDNSVLWTIHNGTATESISHGSKGELLVAGADVDGTGSLDAIAIAAGEASIEWKIRYDPFNGGSATPQSITFGAPTDVPFYYSNGARDLLAVLRTDEGGAQSIRTYDIASSQETAVAISEPVANADRPHPIKASTGEDKILLHTQDSRRTYFTVLNTDGTTHRRFTVPGTGTILVGDYLSQYPGQEVIVSDGARLRIVNAFAKGSKNIVLRAGVLFDSVNINSFGPWGSNPAACTVEDPTDGYKRGFVWKPRSDTQRWAVAVMPNQFTGLATSVDILTSQGTAIASLRNKGCANPDDKGPRCGWIASSPYTGSKLQKDFGAVTLRLNLSNGSCATYLLSAPSKRID